MYPIRIFVIILIAFSISCCAKRYPITANMNIYLAFAYYEEQRGNAFSANRYYQKAIASAPHSGQAHNNYGVFLCRNKQYNQAIKQFFIAAHTSTYKYRAKAYKNALSCQKLRASSFQPPA